MPEGGPIFTSPPSPPCTHLCLKPNYFGDRKRERQREREREQESVCVKEKQKESKQKGSLRNGHVYYEGFSSSKKVIFSTFSSSETTKVLIDDDILKSGNQHDTIKKKYIILSIY